jgi:glutaminyl-tRNA synthetase
MRFRPRHRSTSSARIILAHNAAGRFGGRVHTRFPPSRTAICTSATPRRSAELIGSRARFGGKFNLRFDDTNPVKEEQEYIDAITHDVQWLGCDWGERVLRVGLLRAALRWAVQLDPRGQGVRGQLSAEEISDYRGTASSRREDRDQAGTREPVPQPLASEENLDLFERMRRGEFPDGATSARQDRHGAPELNLRDPIMYRILHATHPRTGERGASTRPTTGRTARAIRSKASRTRSARSSSRTTGRSTTGTSTARHPPPAADRVRAPQPHLYGDEQAPLLTLVRDGTCAAGTTAAADALGLAPARLHARGDRAFVKRVGVAKTESVVDVGMLEEEVRII